jgi:hypothetical protein
MHLDQFTHERVENSQQAQGILPSDAKAWLGSDHSEYALG